MKDQHYYSPIFASIDYSNLLQFITVKMSAFERIGKSMLEELSVILAQNPDEVAKQLLKDVFQKGELAPWTSLCVFLQNADAITEHTSMDEALKSVLTNMLITMEKSKYRHAQILRDIYWKGNQTKTVARLFNDQHGYSQDSGTFYKWLKEARYIFGVLLLQLEDKCNNNEVLEIEPEDDSVDREPDIHQYANIEIFSTLKPLDPEQRERILNSKGVSTSGITLFRLLPAFQYEILEMLKNQGKLRVLLVDYCSPAMHMAALRSESRTPAETQARRIKDMLDLLSRWKGNIPGAQVEARLLDYFPPYGITVIEPRSRTADAQCLVRLFTFQSSTTVAPIINPHPSVHKYWFDFFCEQFEKFWLAGSPYELI